ncbi:MAG: hypothetical protein A3B90_02445 [Candidatus Magasanikbacteria bacterium RIFCSPHIGHO2_02_FULL_41_13]|uniref:Uncharacterized protein n=1 Tax=Candidatus Magasanikbacteria bacterium RIFCSPHIGHO2_02_FULL_41_13 TaxID=1798676 RepID=A0A1F6M418_9BACT|nr:MAG: hypothetical protein A3B90_02445 [Candidatus Magasanikbacteria bacterium RIFCSPHIGHO2_02_FULL_41_13]
MLKQCRGRNSGEVPKRAPDSERRQRSAAMECRSAFLDGRDGLTGEGEKTRQCPKVFGLDEVSTLIVNSRPKLIILTHRGFSRLGIGAKAPGLIPTFSKYF